MVAIIVVSPCVPFLETVAISGSACFTWPMRQAIFQTR
jgi:hypothetical protein